MAAGDYDIEANVVELPCMSGAPGLSHHHTHSGSSDRDRSLLVPRASIPQAHSATEDRNSRMHAWMLATLHARYACRVCHAISVPS
jgi:hypothetical protein